MSLSAKNAGRSRCYSPSETKWEGTVKLSGLRLGGARVVRYLSRMTMPRDPLYAGYRYPAELTSYWAEITGVAMAA